MRRLLYIAALSMLLVAMTASVALGQARGPSGADGTYNCEDFNSQAAAQRYFEADNPKDPAGLDGPIGEDSAGTPGVACEGLGAPKDTEPAPGYAQYADGDQYAEDTDDDVVALPDTGGSSPILLGTAALLMGAGVLGFTLLRRRAE